MPKKIYQSTVYMILVTTVEVNGVGITCSFRGGKYFPYRENGTFGTSDPKVQAALEAHEGFNNRFVLVRTIEDKKIEVKSEESRKPEPVVIPEPEPEPILPIAPILPGVSPVSPTGEVIVSEVKNGQDAKLYLNKHFDVPFSRLKNTEMTMKESKTANLIFPNWKP